VSYQEFKTRSEAALQAKARLEDEVESLMTKLQQFNDIRDESASLKAQIESFTSKHSDDEKRIQELLEQNAQLVLEKERSGEELAVLQGQLEAERSRSSSGSQTTVTVVSPPRLSEAEM
jgi:chromosome segregation ATPase